MSGIIEPSAWVKLPSDVKDDMIDKAKWTLHIRRDVGEDRFYDIILQHFNVNGKHPVHGKMYQDYVKIHSEFPYAGSTEFVEALSRLSLAKPQDTDLTALVKSIKDVHDAAMGIAASRNARGTSLAR